ncbi:MAG: hypothetical protein EXR79_04135 [Myxococcales bacterium]|nr:hypothetical protein [Myxococcales bacterium]
MFAFDSHAHFDDPGGDTAALVAELLRLRAAGWPGALAAGYGPERTATQRAVCRDVAGVGRAAGLHPWWLVEHPDPAEQEAAWTALAADCRESDVRAVGEIGLDRTRKQLAGPAEQRRGLRRGLELARAVGLPVVLHVVGWHGHALQELAAVGVPHGGVVHRYSGPADLVGAYERLGLCISLALEPREDEARRAAVARTVRADRLLVETDWPFLDLAYPAALAALEELAARIARWRGERVEALLERATATGKALFRIADVGRTQP